MYNTIDELAAYLQQTIPQWKTATNVRPDTAGNYISFRWNGRDFLVKRNLETFELKNTNLFVTGASSLMQSALARRNKNQRVIESAIQAIRDAEGLFNNGHTENGLKLVATVKSTISRLARK